jgi:AmiR/NasT family two-component response regulator
MGRVFALVDDLFFRAKIVETARQVEVELACFATPQDLVDEARAHSPALILVDLNSTQNPMGAITQLSPGNSMPIVAFLSHVQTDLAETARRAGCTEVMPRSQFSKELPTILSRAKAAP